MLTAGLRCFLAVVQAGSMREAAQRLHLAQSAISRRIQLLEEELGQPLLERGARGVALTPAGDLLFQHGREAMQSEERLRAELDALRGVRRGHVVLRSVASFGGAELPAIVSAFQAEHPAVTLEVGVVGTEAVVEDVRERRCHIGVAFNPAVDADFDVLASAPEPAMAVMSPRHPLACAGRLSIPELAAYPLILPTRLGRLRLLVDAAFRGAGLEPRCMLETNSTHLIAATAANDRVVALISPRVLALHLQVGRLVALPMREPVLNSGRMVLLARHGRRLPAAAAALAAELAEAMARRDPAMPFGPQLTAPP
jgi:DNA-binding transcriptional LysR family regulator